MSPLDASLGRNVSAVIVTHNAEADTGPCLRSLRGQLVGPGRIIVVDNGSTDETVDQLRHLPDVLLLEQHNTGFAHGVNRGIAAAPLANDILVLNADVELDAGAVAAMIRVLGDEPGTAIVVPRMEDDTGHTFPSLKRDPSVLRTAVEAVVGGSRAGRLGEAYLPGRERADVPWATGAAMLLRREALLEVGGLDESFFLYSEETELCLRVRDAGYRVRVEPEAVVRHRGGDLPTHPTLWALRAVNRVRLYRRRHGRVAAGSFRLALLLFEGRRAAMSRGSGARAVRSLLRPDLDAMAIRLTEELDGDTAVIRSASASGRFRLRNRRRWRPGPP